jgi:hypothetical protein
MREDKVGLLTFHHVLNYGAVLQCFALQEVIKDIYGNCTVIPYECKKLSENDKLIKRGHITLIQIAKAFSQGYGNCRKRKKFRGFIETYLNLDASVNWDNFETIIVGSDQVWNLILTDNDYTYLLEHINCKKIAYAASMGENDIRLDDRERLFGDIRNFDSVSLRESVACELLAQHDIETKEVLDPVFLLDRRKWESLAMKVKISMPKHYILVYCVEKSQEVFSYARTISEKYEYPIIYLNQNMFFKEKNFSYRRGTSPIDFLQYIYRADFIITNSFHGTAFSIIFHKKFACDLAWHKRENKRLANLLKKIDLEQRSISCLRSENNGIEAEINYIRVKEKLSGYIDNSKEFLKKALEK